MTKSNQTRLKNLRAKKADPKHTLKPRDLIFLKKLTALERQESVPPAPPDS